ncbi:uncharacterized protein LOC101858301 isoform X1 [Aplysia californica]|uniref:Uncharacterized protein LOC101858301 isoform X1 n=2 Tax=Aplysia californica TaxID=6500 RepID=A0ABM0K388_APLCA|nr:uncharacterized protein LOC101858301 isoform X1 [Aplysia californica]
MNGMRPDAAGALWKDQLLEAAETDSVCDIQRLLQTPIKVTKELQDDSIEAVYLALKKGKWKVLLEILTSRIFKEKHKQRLLTEFPNLLYYTVSLCEDYKKVVRRMCHTLALPDTTVSEIFGLLNEDGFSALHLAAIDGDVDSARRILALGGSGYIPSQDGNTALSLSIAFNHPHFWKFVLPFSNVNTCDNDCDTPLMFACWRRQHKLVNALIQSGADCNARSKLHTSALWNAVYKCSYHCVRILLESGADMTVRCEGTYLFLNEESDGGEEGSIKQIYPGAFRSLLWVCVDRCGQRQNRSRSSCLQILSLLLAAGYDPTQDHWIKKLASFHRPERPLNVSKPAHCLPFNVVNDSGLINLLMYVYAQPLQLRSLCRNKIRLLFVENKTTLSFKKWVSALKVGVNTSQFLTLQYL